MFSQEFANLSSSPLPTLGNRFPFTTILLSLFIFHTFLLSGCGNAVKTEADPEQLATAEQFVNAGDYEAAAKQYLLIAETIPPESVEEEDVPKRQTGLSYRLLAAETYLKGGDTLAAQKILVRIDRSQLIKPLLIRYDLTNARIALANEQPEKVIAALENIPLTRTSPEAAIQTEDTESEEAQQAKITEQQDALLLQVLSMRIDAFTELEEQDQATLSRIQIDPLLEESARAENRRAIWQNVQSFDIESLDQTRNSTLDPVFLGWLDLSLLARQYLFNADTFQSKILEWQQTYPNHPAEQPILTELFERSAVLGKKISSIALLIPGKGRFEQAGAAVRDGFLSAWYADNDSAEQPEVKVYNTDSNNIIRFYQQAVEDGVDLVVGPLDKKSLLELLSQPELPVPALALNQLNDDEIEQYRDFIDSDRLYQFGLPPEQEARQVAEKAWLDGYDYALSITPAGAWGQRLQAAFEQHFEELGGTVIEQQTFNMQGRDYSTPVKKLLNVDGSIQRYDALSKQLNRKIKFEPRSRKDMQFVFLAAQPTQARQLRPQLLFYRASATPVLATSHAYGIPARDEPDLDMEGVVFGDMPWLLEHKPKSDENEDPLSMQSNWPEDNAAFLRLYALGVDAYRVIPLLGKMRLLRDTRYEGGTGTLSLDENARVQRQLSWAKLIEGKPVIQRSQKVRELEQAAYHNGQSNP